MKVRSDSPKGRQNSKLSEYHNFPGAWKIPLHSILNTVKNSRIAESLGQGFILSFALLLSLNGKE